MSGSRFDSTRGIRAPRGATLNARSWHTEAPLRMLMNNLDANARDTQNHASYDARDEVH